MCFCLLDTRFSVFINASFNLSIHAAICLLSHHLFIVGLLAVRSIHQYLRPCFCAPVCKFSVSSTENSRNLNLCRNFLKPSKQLSQLRAVSEVLSDGFLIISESLVVHFALCFSGVFPSPGPRPSRSLQRAFQSPFTRVFFRWHQENQRGHRETECGLEQPQQEVNHPFAFLVYMQVLLLIWASVSHCCIFDLFVLVCRANDRRAQLDSELKEVQVSLKELESFLRWLQEAETTVTVLSDASQREDVSQDSANVKELRRQLEVGLEMEKETSVCV